eukprot:1033403-Pyramimonas_sp.AAC.1
MWDVGVGVSRELLGVKLPGVSAVGECWWEAPFVGLEGLPVMLHEVVDDGRLWSSYVTYSHMWRHALEIGDDGLPGSLDGTSERASLYP